MKVRETIRAAVRLLLAIILIATPLAAQRRRPVTPKPSPPAQPAQPALTFETLLAADSYKVYGEIRGVGQLLRSGGVNDVLDPVMKLASPPKEFKTVAKWLNSHADSLMTSRLMFAGWPSRPNLPQVLFVLEFSSQEEAQKFEPQIKAFLPQVLPTPVPSPGAGSGKNESSGAKGTDAAAAPPSYILKQSGPLVLISESEFTLKALRPAGTKLLSEDQDFRQVHDRFSAESVFLYFDVGSAEKEQQERMLQMQEEEKKRQELAAANPTPAEVEEIPTEEPPPSSAPEEIASVELSSPPPAEPATEPDSPDSKNTPDLGLAHSGFDRLASALFFGRPKWPEAVGLALAFDADTYVARALLVNGPETKASMIPIAPQLIPGPPLAPEAASVLPASTEMLVTFSLDLPMIYEGTLKNIARENEMRGTIGPLVRANQPDSPFAVYEKKLGLKIKEDVLPLFGNEVALSMPFKAFGLSAPQPRVSSSPQPTVDGSSKASMEPVPSTPQPVIAISVKDKEAVRLLIPKVIDALGFKGASQLAQVEKRDDTELVTYAGAVSYAFIGNFLIASADPKAVRNVVESYLNHETLAGNTSFRDSTRWQPRQVLGQVYVSPALMEGYSRFSRDLNLVATDALRDFLTRISPAAEPVTFAISNEGLGPLYELHLPKNLVLLLVAGFASENNVPPVERNEAIAQSALRTIHSAEATYQAMKGEGHYGTLDQLLEQNLVYKDFLQQHGYKIELTASGSRFEATAVPQEYGKTGRLSFFMDETGVLRSGDHGGGAATVADKPVQ